MATIALTIRKPARATVVRGIAAGVAWGAVMATALLGLSLYRCGAICLGQIVETTALAIAVGIFAIGPVAMLRRESPKLR